MIAKRMVSIVILCSLLLAMTFTLYSCYNVSTGSYTGGRDRIAVLRVEGVISSGQGAGSMFGMTGAYADKIVSDLRKTVEDNGIKAVVVRINSPGGSAAGSEEVFNALMEVRDAGKPVIASMADVAASGGYFIASAADQIYADATTLTGSIGVIMEVPSFEGLFEKLGLGMNTLKAGALKDIGSPYREMTPQERKLLEGMLAESHEVFIESVAKGRGVPVEQIRPLATGMIYTGKGAKENGLIDEIGGMRDAILKAAELAGISGEPVIEELGKENILDQLLGIEQQSPLPMPMSGLELLSKYMFLQPLLTDERLYQVYR